MEIVIQDFKSHVYFCFHRSMCILCLISILVNNRKGHTLFLIISYYNFLTITLM